MWKLQTACDRTTVEELDQARYIFSLRIPVVETRGRLPIVRTESARVEQTTALTTRSFISRCIYSNTLVHKGYQGAAGAGDSAGHWGGAISAMGMWFGETWGYLVLIGAAWGGIVGWLARYTSQENLYTLTVVISVGLSTRWVSLPGYMVP